MKEIKDLKEYLENRIKSVEETYKKEMKPYQTDIGLVLTGLTKKEREEVISKRNCLLIQKEVYKEVLKEIENE